MTDLVACHHRERGSSLAALLFLIVPLAALGGSILTLGARQLSEQDASRGRSVALLNAESGVDAALLQLMEDGANLAPLEEEYEQGGSLRYRATFEALSDDGVDNDGDGAVDEGDEAQYVRITSRGSLNVMGYDVADAPIAPDSKFYVKRVRVTARKLSGLPEFPYAVYLGDPNAEVDLNGNAFLIDGNDHDLGGGLSSDPPVPGIATTGDPEHIVDQLSSQQADNVDGEGGSPAVSNTAAVDLSDLIADYKSAADYKFEGDVSYQGDLGHEGSYKVTYATGNLKISGGGEGAGLLLVEGNLVITGAWDYIGVIIVTGQVVFRGGGGGKRVIGSLLVGGDVIDTDTNGEDLEVSGTVDLFYSSAAQSAVADAVSSYTLFGWQEL